MGRAAGPSSAGRRLSAASASRQRCSPSSTRRQRPRVQRLRRGTKTPRAYARAAPRPRAARRCRSGAGCESLSTRQRLFFRCRAPQPWLRPRLPHCRCRCSHAARGRRRERQESKARRRRLSPRSHVAARRRCRDADAAAGCAEGTKESAATLPSRQHELPKASLRRTHSAVRTARPCGPTALDCQGTEGTRGIGADLVSVVFAPCRHHMSCTSRSGMALSTALRASCVPRPKQSDAGDHSMN